ncbi:MAG: alpha/beta hydrolase [Planctomycetota bacterium]
MALSILRHESEVLSGNACGDPHVRELWVYTPPTAEPCPVLFCLSAFGASGEKACVGNRWSPGLPARLDRLIAQGMPPVIVAFPDCFTRWGGSQYLNSEATGRYEDYLCDELVPFVESEFRTTGRRGLFGKSSGGYGALRIAMRRPGLFQAIASHSADMGFELVYAPDFAGTLARLAEFDSLAAWVEQFESREKMAGADFAVVNTIAMSACYSPDANEPFGFRFPFDRTTGERIPAIWKRWRDHDPIEMDPAALRELDLLYLDCGSKDELFLHLGLRRFLKRLDALGIAYEAEEFPDSHRSLNYRYDVSLPKLSAALHRR